MTQPWPLVGRSWELDEVAAAIGRFELAGVVLAGDAGVGKTRLATECLRIAEQAGFVTAAALATRAASTIPLGALAPLLPAPPEGEVGPASLVQAARALAARGAAQPLLLLVDDAQLLDAASATVVQHLTREPNVFVLVTIRSGERASDAIAALWKDELALRIHVRPLDRDETEQLLAAALGDHVDGHTTRQLWQSSEGNPLLLRELVLGAQEAKLLVSQGGVVRLVAPLGASPRLVELVEARLQDLDEGPRSTLEIVALGEPISLDVLMAMTESADVELLESRGLLRVHIDGVRHEARLAHPVHGDVVRETLPALRAMAIERRLSETLRATGARRRDDPLRVAVWSLSSGSRVELPELLAAAQYAWFAHDYELTERLARAAVHAGGGVSARLLLGETLSLQGRPADAEAMLRDAAALTQDDRECALVALTRGVTLYWGLDERKAAADVLRDALAVLPPGAWRDEVTGGLATYELLDGRPRAALARVGVIAEAAGGRPFVEAAIAAAPALAIVGRCDEAIAVADRALTVHLELGEQIALSSPGIHLVSRCLALIEAGRLDEAWDTAQFGYEQAVRDGAREGHAWFALMLGRARWLREPRRAVRWFREGAAVFADLGQRGGRRWCLGGAAFAAATAGDAAADELADAALAVPGQPFGMMQSDVLRALAWCAVRHGDLIGGRRRIDDAVALASEQGATALMSAALHDHVRLGIADDVADLLAAAAAEVDGPFAAARSEHARTLLAADANGLAVVAERFAEIGAWVLAAEAAAHAAGVARRDGDTRASERYAHRSHELARAAGGLSTPALAHAGHAAALTRRELEIAALAAQGRSNPEIAQTLFVSVRTVGNHLHRVYEKLGVNGRDELASALGRLDAPH